MVTFLDIIFFFAHVRVSAREKNFSFFSEVHTCVYGRSFVYAH